MVGAWQLMFLLPGLAVQTSVISIGIDIGILLYRAMNVGLVLWLGMAHVVGRGFDVPTTRHDGAGFSAGAGGRCGRQGAQAG
jgi:hypothetical protein